MAKYPPWQHPPSHRKFDDLFAAWTTEEVLIDDDEERPHVEKRRVNADWDEMRPPRRTHEDHRYRRQPSLPLSGPRPSRYFSNDNCDSYDQFRGHPQKGPSGLDVAAPIPAYIPIKSDRKQLLSSQLQKCAPLLDVGNVVTSTRNVVDTSPSSRARVMVDFEKSDTPKLVSQEATKVRDSPSEEGEAEEVIVAPVEETSEEEEDEVVSKSQPAAENKAVSSESKSSTKPVGTPASHQTDTQQQPHFESEEITKCGLFLRTGLECSRLRNLLIETALQYRELRIQEVTKPAVINHIIRRTVTARN